MRKVAITIGIGMIFLLLFVILWAEGMMLTTGLILGVLVTLFNVYRRDKEILKDLDRLDEMLKAVKE